MRDVLIKVDFKHYSKHNQLNRQNKLQTPV